MEEELIELLVDNMSSRWADLSWQWPTDEDDLWVFWTEEKVSNHTTTNSDHHVSVQDRVKTALFDMDSYGLDGDVLVQFWAATTTMTDEGDRRLLTTSDQPFALNRLTNEKLNRYKKNRPNYEYVDQGEEEHNLTDGSIGRVFRMQLPEVSPDVSYYSVIEYPERDLALGCGIKSTLALPVFDPSLQGCVGVLEFLFTEFQSFHIKLFVDGFVRELQEAGLQTVNLWESQNVQFSLAMGELFEAMAQVREKHGLFPAKIWARCEQISSVDRGGCLSKTYNDFDVNCRGDFLVSIISKSGSHLQGFNLYDSLYLPLRVGHSLFGMVFHSDEPFFCRDVTQLSIIDYPMAHIARSSGFKSCFMVCLQSVATGNRDYALEFLLPRDKRHGADLHNFLSSILTILKHHLKGFEVVTGDFRKDYLTGIDNMTVSNVEASMVKEKNVTRPGHLRSSELTQILKSLNLVTEDCRNDSFTAIDNLIESKVEASMVKGNNILREQGNTFFTPNTLNTSSGHKTRSSSYTFTDYELVSALNTSSGHKTRSSSYTFTDYELVSALNTPSGHETVPSAPPSVASAYEQISILTSQVQYMQADIAQFQKLVDEYKASSCQSTEL